MIDIKNSALAAAKAYRHNLDITPIENNISTQMLMLYNNCSVSVAKRLSARFPDFQSFESVAFETQNAVNRGDGENYQRGLMQQFDVLMKFTGNDRFGMDPAFLAVESALVGYMNRFQDFKENQANIFLIALDSIDDEVVGLDTILLVCIGMWFANYKDFRSRVLELIPQLEDEGFYDDYTPKWESRHTYPDGILRMNPEPDPTRLSLFDSANYNYNAWQDLYLDQNTLWFTQTDRSLNDMIPYGRAKFMESFDELNAIYDGAWQRTYDEALALAKEKSLKISRDFDMTVTYQDLDREERTTRVPRQVKKSFFRTETVYDTKTETFYSHHREIVRFSAWKLAHFERIYRFSDPARPIMKYDITSNWDYCLGDDGGLYLITTSYTTYDHPESPNGANFSQNIRKLLPFDSVILPLKNENLFLGVIHGLLFTLDYIPINFSEEHSHRDENGKEVDTVYFPIQTDEGNRLFGIGGGILERLERLA